MDRWDIKRTHSINLKLNDYEYDMLRLKSDKTGKNKSAYLRELICGACPVEAPPKKFYDAVNELNKIGLNINQLAVKANTTSCVSEDDIEFLKKTADDIFDRLTEIKRIVRTARPYAVGYFEKLALKQRESKTEGKPVPDMGDDMNEGVIYKYEDEEDDTEVKSLYETEETYDVSTYFN